MWGTNRHATLKQLRKRGGALLPGGIALVALIRCVISGLVMSFYQEIAKLALKRGFYSAAKIFLINIFIFVDS